jgi:hypothetical protein
LNIQKGQLCVKENLAQDLGFVCGPFQGELGGILGVEAGRGAFNDWARVARPFLGSSGHTGSFPPPILLLFLRLKVSIPGVVGFPMKVIVVHGELRELIQDVSGRP